MKILVKVNRLCAWLLFPFMLILFITGVAIVGKYDFNKLIEPNFAFKVHSFITIPSFICFFIHSGLSIFFVVRRWLKRIKK